MMTPQRPLLSVIVPAYQGEGVLPHALAALAASDLPREFWELIVVDDASTDGTPLVAARYADAVVRLPGRPRGPGYARNRGAETARGEVLVFVDADVCVHPDTLRRFAWLFAADPELGAAFGSYDAAPPAPGLVSQYRNLLHHYVHHRNAGEAETFWAGCGAVRRAAFFEAGGFDEWHFARPQIEDIDLGQRLRAIGRRILLRPEIQCTHLKRWTLRNLVVTDFRDRGVPWMRLLVQQGKRGRSDVLNVSLREKLNVAWMGLAVASLAAAAVTLDPRPLLLVGACLGLVVASNLGLYAWFARVRGARFALAVVPLHLLYYLLNGCSAACGWLLHHLVGPPRPPAEVQAFAEVGSDHWPPVPRRAKGSVWAQ